eukprot:XP_017175965.1 PREDICTED: uncharacterized protein LOC108168925 isoform X5 [Mus musculus]
MHEEIHLNLLCFSCKAAWWSREYPSFSAKKKEHRRILTYPSVNHSLKGSPIVLHCTASQGARTRAPPSPHPGLPRLSPYTPLHLLLNVCLLAWQPRSQSVAPYLDPSLSGMSGCLRDCGVEAKKPAVFLLKCAPAPAPVQVSSSVLLPLCRSPQVCSCPCAGLLKCAPVQVSSSVLLPLCRSSQVCSCPCAGLLKCAPASVQVSSSVLLPLCRSPQVCSCPCAGLLKCAPVQVSSSVLLLLCRSPQVCSCSCAGLLKCAPVQVSSSVLLCRSPQVCSCPCAGLLKCAPAPVQVFSSVLLLLCSSSQVCSCAGLLKKI